MLAWERDYLVTGVRKEWPSFLWDSWRAFHQGPVQKGARQAHRQAHPLSPTSLW